MASPLPAGELSTWAADHRLVLGNELTGDRPWLGRLERVVLYDRPLSPAEVAEHHAAGAPAAESAGAVADYRFAEGDGTRVRDHRGAYDLELPLAFVNDSTPELLDPAPRRPADLAASFAIFLPLGALTALAFGGPRPGTRAAAVAFLAAALVALIAESLQYYVADRTSSALDLLGAIAGALVGAAAPALAARR
jgi:VanZ family protein